MTEDAAIPARDPLATRSLLGASLDVVEQLAAVLILTGWALLLVVAGSFDAPNGNESPSWLLAASGVFAASYCAQAFDLADPPRRAALVAGALAAAILPLGLAWGFVARSAGSPGDDGLRWCLLAALSLLLARAIATATLAAWSGLGARAFPRLGAALLIPSALLALPWLTANLERSALAATRDLDGAPVAEIASRLRWIPAYRGARLVRAWRSERHVAVRSRLAELHATLGLGAIEDRKPRDS